MRCEDLSQNVDVCTLLYTEIGCIHKSVRKSQVMRKLWFSV